MIYLTPERRLCFLFDQASSLQDSELSKEVLLEEVLCKSLFPHQQHGQPAGQPPLHSHFIASSPAPNLCQKECQIECQSIYIYLSVSVCLSVSSLLSIYLSIYLAGWLAGKLATYLSRSNLPPENLNVSQADVHLGVWKRKRGIAWVPLRHR